MRPSSHRERIRSEEVEFPSQGRGQGYVELMLILPILLVVFIGMVEAGWWLHSYLAITNAARSGARFGSRSIAVPLEDVSEITVVAMSDVLEPRLSGSGANATVIVTEVDVEADGTISDIRQEQFGDLVVDSDVCDSDVAACDSWNVDIRSIGTSNSAFNDEFCQIDPGEGGCYNDFVVVEAFYIHEQILKMPVVSDFLPDPFFVKGESVMRVTMRRQVEP